MPETPPPKPEDYAIVDGSDGPRRDFRISVGLREGWDAEGRVFDVSEAVRTARAWMRRRVEAGDPALSGMFTRAEVTYAWPREDGTVGSDRKPVALFTGEAVHAYLGHLPDAANRSGASAHFFGCSMCLSIQSMTTSATCRLFLSCMNMWLLPLMPRSGREMKVKSPPAPLICCISALQFGGGCGESQ